jgi:SH3 domain-containing YSC84-like protein 1
VEFLLTNILSGEYHRGSPATSRIWETVSIKTYSRSQGLFAGASLEGTVLVAQPDKNANYYGRSVTPEQILRGRVPAPPSARPLISALTRY